VRLSWVPPTACVTTDKFACLDCLAGAADLRRATLGPPVVYTFTERIISGDCERHLTIDIAAASGGLGYRNTDGVAAILAIAGPPPTAEELALPAGAAAAAPGGGH